MSLLQKMFGKRQKRTHPYCAALIAAAGSSTRYGGENKLLQTLDGIPVLVRPSTAPGASTRSSSPRGRTSCCLMLSSARPLASENP